MAVSSLQMLPVVGSDTTESPSTSFVVKNTFLELSTEDNSPCSLRRCVSAPATPRGGESSKNADGFGITSSASLPFNMASPASWSTASTLAQDAEDISTCSGSSVDACALDASETASVASTQEGMVISLEELLPAKKRPLKAALSSQARAFVPSDAAPPKVKLTSQAKAWVPACQPTGGNMGLPPEVHHRFANIINAGQAALKACTLIKRAEVNDVATSWSLSGALQPESFHHAGNVLAVAQNALLDAAKQSQNVYIIGYEAQPFKAIPGKVGFRAQLALVQDESSACWDLVAKGYCHRGCACRWQHPSWQVSVDVVMEPSFV